MVVHLSLFLLVSRRLDVVSRRRHLSRSDPNREVANGAADHIRSSPAKETNNEDDSTERESGETMTHEEGDGECGCHRGMVARWSGIIARALRVEWRRRSTRLGRSGDRKRTIRRMHTGCVIESNPIALQ